MQIRAILCSVPVDDRKPLSRLRFRVGSASSVNTWQCLRAQARTYRCMLQRAVSLHFDASALRGSWGSWGSGFIRSDDRRVASTPTQPYLPTRLTISTLIVSLRLHCDRGCYSSANSECEVRDLREAHHGLSGFGHKLCCTH